MNRGPLRVGIVGFGSIAEHGHLPAWQSFDEVEVCAIADRESDRLSQARALAHHAVLFDSPRALIEQSDIDVVDICTPPNMHADLIEMACRRRIPYVVSEKPLVLTEDEYLRLATAREESGCRIVSVNNWLHSDLFRHVQRALANGEIGEIRSVMLRTRRPDAARGSAWNPSWRTDVRHAGGGIVLDHGWHQLYLILGWIGQPLRAVSASMRTVDPRHRGVEDEAEVTLHFRSARGVIELSWHADGRQNSGIIEGSRGTIYIHDDRIEVDGERGVHRDNFRGKLTESSYHPDWFESIFRYNVLDECGREAARNFTEAGLIVAAIRGAYRSAAAGGVPVTISATGGDRRRIIEGAESQYVRGGCGGYSSD